MVLKDPREKPMIDERNKTLWLCLFKKSLLEKVLSGVKHVRLDMTARDKGAPDKGHTTLFSSSKIVHYFPNFRSYLGMEYEQPWNMGKILLEYWIYQVTTTGGHCFQVIGQLVAPSETCQVAVRNVAWRGFFWHRRAPGEPWAMKGLTKNRVYPLVK